MPRSGVPVLELGCPKRPPVGRGPNRPGDAEPKSPPPSVVGAAFSSTVGKS